MAGRNREVLTMETVEYICKHGIESPLTKCEKCSYEGNKKFKLLLIAYGYSKGFRSDYLVCENHSLGWWENHMLDCIGREECEAEFKKAKNSIDDWYRQHRQENKDDNGRVIFFHHPLVNDLEILDFRMPSIWHMTNDTGLTLDGCVEKLTNELGLRGN